MKSRLEIFSEINEHLMRDEKPSIYFNAVSDDLLFTEYPFTILSKMQTTKQSPRYHPEGSVWNHTMLVIDAAAKVKTKSSNAPVFMWAALLHDIGKPDTTKNRNGKITSYDHDKVGAELAGNFLKELGCEENFIQAVSALVRWHMQLLFVTKSLPFADIKEMRAQTKTEDAALLGFCDRMGRLGANRSEEEKNVALFLQKCSSHRDSINQTAKKKKNDSCTRQAETTDQPPSVTSCP